MICLRENVDDELKLSSNTSGDAGYVNFFPIWRQETNGSMPDVIWKSET